MLIAARAKAFVRYLIGRAAIEYKEAPPDEQED
jgi:hypothetical protein